MKLTSFTDYSLRVLIFLAAQPGRRATIAEIAAAFEIKENHLTKVVHFLGQVGLLTNVRGKGGGLDLARDPSQIVIGAVVREAEGAVVPAECFGENPGCCRITPVCRLRGVMREAVDAFYRVLDACTLEDITRNRAALARALFTESAGQPGWQRMAAPARTRPAAASARGTERGAGRVATRRR